MNRALALLTVVLWSVLLPFTGWGQVSADIRWASDTLSIGRPVDLHLTLRYPKDATIEMPEEAQLLPGFELLENKLESRREEDGHVVEKRRYRVASFRVDSVQNVQFRFRAIVNGDSSILETNTAGIILNSRLPKDKRLDELAFKRQMNLPELKPPFPWAVFVLVFSITGLLLGGAAWWFWPVYMRRKQLKAAAADNHAHTAAVQAVPTDSLVVFINQLNSIWKPYLSDEQIVDFSSLTAKELQARRYSLGLSETDAHAVIELQQAEEDLNYADRSKLDTTLCTKRALNLLQTAYDRRVQSIIDQTPKRL